jgi:hypothetical protein
MPDLGLGNHIGRYISFVTRVSYVLIYYLYDVFLFRVLRFSISGLATGHPKSSYMYRPVGYVTMLDSLMHKAITCATKL